MRRTRPLDRSARQLAVSSRDGIRAARERNTNSWLLAGYKKHNVMKNLKKLCRQYEISGMTFGSSNEII